MSVFDDLDEAWYRLFPEWMQHNRYLLKFRFGLLAAVCLGVGVTAALVYGFGFYPEAHATVGRRLWCGVVGAVAGYLAGWVVTGLLYLATWVIVDLIPRAVGMTIGLIVLSLLGSLVVWFLNLETPW